MKELSVNEIEQVNGGMNEWTAGGMTVIGIGLAGGVATGAFGLAVGGSMMFIGHMIDKHGSN